MSKYKEQNGMYILDETEVRKETERKSAKKKFKGKEFKNMKREEKDELLIVLAKIHGLIE